MRTDRAYCGALERRPPKRGPTRTIEAWPFSSPFSRKGGVAKFPISSVIPDVGTPASGRGTEDPGPSLRGLSAANNADWINDSAPLGTVAAHSVQVVEAGSRICALFERSVRDDGRERERSVSQQSRKGRRLALQLDGAQVTVA